VESALIDAREQEGCEHHHDINAVGGAQDYRGSIASDGHAGKDRAKATRDGDDENDE